MPQEPAAAPTTLPKRDSALLDAFRAANSVGVSGPAPSYDYSRQDGPLPDDESLAVQYALAVPRGVEGLAKGLYGFADFLTFDSLPDWKKRLLGSSTHWSAALLEGLSTYAIPGGVAVKAFGAAQKGAGWAGRVSRLARGAMAGAVVDAVVTDPRGGRLSDWAKEAGVDWAVTDFLATDPDDSEAVARFKNAIEGIVPGVALDGVAEVFRAVRGARAGKPVSANPKPVRQAMAGLWREEFGFDHDQAASVEAFVDAAGLDRSKIRPASELPFEVREGMDPEARAFVKFAQDGTAFIGALKNPDVTSALHEMAHVARRQLFDTEAGVAPRLGLTTSDVKVAAEWAGATKKRGGGFAWNEAAEEKFAAGFERYLRDGVAPSKTLEGFFQRVATYFRRVYQTITGTALDVDVTPEVAEVFGRVLSRGERMALTRTEVRAVGRVREGVLALGRNAETKEGRLDLVLYSKDGGLRRIGPEGAEVADPAGVVAQAAPDSPFPGSLEAAVSKATADSAFLYRASLEPEQVLTVKAGAEPPDAETLRKGGYLAWTEEGSEQVHLAGEVQVERMGQSTLGASDLLNLRAPGLTRALAKDQDVLYQGARRQGDAPQFGNAKFDPAAPLEPINMDRIASPAALRQTFLDALSKAEAREAAVQSLEVSHAKAIETLQEFADASGEAAPQDLMKALIGRSADQVAEHARRLGAAREVLVGMGRQMYDRIQRASEGGLKAATDEDLVDILRYQQSLAQGAELVRGVQSEIALALGAQRIRYRGDALSGREWIPPKPEGSAPKPGPEVATPELVPSTPGGDVKPPIKPEVEIAPSKDLPGASVAAIIERHGGRKKVERMVRQIENYLDANPDGIPPILKPKGWLAMVPEYYINSILSGPITHAVNTLSGMMNTLVLPIERAVGNVAVGRPSQAGKELSEIAWHAREAHEAVKLAALAAKRDHALLIPEGGGVREGANTKAISAASQGVDAESLSGRVLTAVGKVVNVSSRLLLTEDEAIKQLNYRAHFGRRLTEIAYTKFDTNEARAEWVEQMMKAAGEEGQFYSAESLRRRGAVLARKNGVPADKEAEWVAAYVRTHWDEEAHRAALEGRQRARLATFTEEFGDTRGEGGLTKGVLGFSVRDSVRGISAKVASLSNYHPSMRLIFPFVRTPVNILSWFMDRTGGAISDAAGALFRTEIRRGITREGVADIAGRFATGTALITVAAHAASKRDDNGLPVLTGAGPTDPDERRLWEATGWRPYSIRVGDRYISYKRIDPAATFFGVVADLVQDRAYAEMLNRQPEVANALMIAVMNNLVSKTYLLGAVNFARAIGEPERYGPQLALSYAGAAMPFSSAVHQAVNPLKGDQVLHEIRGLGAAFRSKWAFADPKSLPVRRNVLGEAMERDRGVGGDPWSPLRYVRTKDDALAEEMVRIGAAFQPPRETSNGVDWTGYRNEETGQTAYDRWMELHGSVEIGGRTLRQALEQTIARSSYQRLPVTGVDDLDSPRVAALRRLISRYREKARRQTFDEFPQLSSDARKLLLATHMMRSGQAVEATGVR